MPPRTDQPRITVLMAVHNGLRYLPEAVNSILRQTFTDFEFIIINDGSTDGSAEWLETLTDSRIRLVHQNNIGLTKSLNRGLSMARGEFIARMDADDIALPKRLDRQVAYMEHHPQCVAAGTSFRLINAVGVEVGIQEAETASDRLSECLLENSSITILHPSAIIRTDVLSDVGGYRTEFPRSQDYDLWLRLDEIGELGNLSDVLMLYRVHYSRATFADRRVQLECADRALADAYGRRGLRGIPPRYSTDLTRYPGSKEEVLRESWMLARYDRAYWTACRYAFQLLWLQPQKFHHWKLVMESVCGRRLFVLGKAIYRWTCGQMSNMKIYSEAQRPPA